MPKKIRALLATARIANVPSVIINVLTGMLLKRFFYDAGGIGWNENTLFPIIAACCLYVAGNFLNDWYDVAWDQEHRPERAIPSGLFTRDLYLSVALLLVGVGGIMAWWVNVLITYVVIFLLVVAYTLLHKRYAFSIWIMGACRAGLYALGLNSVHSVIGVLGYLRYFPDWRYFALCGVVCFPFLGMITYIAGISLLARYETRPAELSSTKLTASFLLLFPLMTHMYPWVVRHYFGVSLVHTWVGILGLFPFLCWTLFVVCSKAAVGQKVARLLAGIALVDSVYLLSLGLGLGLAIESAPYYNNLFTVAFLPLIAFLLALLLQKIAPAT